MESISLQQYIPSRQKIFISSTLIVLGFSFLEDNKLIGILLLILAFVTFFVNYNLIITKAFTNYYQVTIFKTPVFKINKTLFFPDYVSLFNQSFVQTNHVGYMPDILGDSKYKLYTIKFFKGNKNAILYMSSNRSEVEKLGTDLANMLDVELHNTLK